MARPRKPAAQHELDGTFRADRHAGEPAYPAGAPTRPPDVDAFPVARREWDAYVQHMTTVGTLAVVDGAVLAQLCVLTAIREELAQQLQRGGTLVLAAEVGVDDVDEEEDERPRRRRTGRAATRKKRTKTSKTPAEASPARVVTLKVHPLAKEIRSLTSAIRGCAADLGLTPTSRGRAATTPDRPHPDAGPTSRVAQLQAAGRQLRAV